MSKLEKRRDSDGRIRFSFRYIDVDGTRKRHTPDVDTEHEALRIMAEVRARIARGIVGVPDVTANERQASTITLSAMLERWLNEAHTSSKCPKTYRIRFSCNIRHIIGILGDVSVASIRRGDVGRCVAEWERQGSPMNTRNYRLSALSRLWVWGQDTGLIDESAPNPTRRMMRPVRSHSIDFYSKHEVAKLLDTSRADQRLHTLIATASHTGMRKGELYGLRWRDVNLHNGTLHIERSYRSLPKSGRTRTVPLHPQLAVLLKAWHPHCPPTPEDLVFPVITRRGHVRMGTSVDEDDVALADLLRRTGCHQPEKPWHAFRHTFASHYVMAGGNLAALQRHLGHHSIQQTMAYAHLAPDFAATDLARLDFSPKPSAQVIDFPKRSRRATR